MAAAKRVLAATDTENGGDSPARFASVWIDLDDPLIDLARNTEARLFYQAWYADQSPVRFAEEAADEFGSYEPGSRFVLVLDLAGGIDGVPQVAGVTRLLDGDCVPLKTIDDMSVIWGIDHQTSLSDLPGNAFEWTPVEVQSQRVSANGSGVWDISSLAVDPSYRSRGLHIYSILSYESLQFSLSYQARSWTTVLVERLYRHYTDAAGVPFRRICEAPTLPHMRELSVPAVMHFSELPSMKTHPTNPNAPAFYRRFVEGELLRHIRVTSRPTTRFR